MKKVSVLAALTVIMLTMNSCSGEGVQTSNLSESLKTEYDFYEDSIGNIKDTMEITQEEADSVFTTLVTECGVDEKIQYVFKNGTGDKTTYAVWAGLQQLEVSLKDNKIETVTENSKQIYPAVHENVLIKAKIKTADVMNGFGTEKIGERAYIEIKKAELEQITQEDFTEFANDVVKGSGYNYVTIICEDSTGVMFPGAEIIIVSYGMVADDGMLEETIGDIMLQEDGTYTYEERK